MKRIAQAMAVVVVIALVVLGAVAWQYFVNHNWRTVEEGAFYGSRQMSGAAFESTIRDYGIRTVVNLRGAHPGEAWYDEEVAACARAGAAHADFAWSRNSLPEPESLAAFVALLETGEKPFLVHCQGGTHRTGAAAACYELWRGKSTATARKQFGPMFKDAPIGKIVDLYEGSGMPFAQWVHEIYPARYAEFESASQAESAPATPAPTGA